MDCVGWLSFLLSLQNTPCLKALNPESEPHSYECRKQRPQSRSVTWHLPGSSRTPGRMPGRRRRSPGREVGYQFFGYQGLDLRIWGSGFTFLGHRSKKQQSLEYCINSNYFRLPLLAIFQSLVSNPEPLAWQKAQSRSRSPNLYIRAP